ncbi:hypothetical protein DENIS_4343 [Desulfonema ishimotonii]|uniref:Uncharacterized protein n=1 Tax=Desulfonema ishimotonii TaxID=45657 RepID=A0A401G290_9BACT|nr:hypothetical protein [Desulfonema ishimotonii]GBC63349.1 hypothetical protein DENIS_4343 [Desulfonema ishimotonii]
MGEILIRKAQADDLPRIQAVASRTTDKRCWSFPGDDAVDRFIKSGERKSWFLIRSQADEVYGFTRIFFEKQA